MSPPGTAELRQVSQEYRNRAGLWQAAIALITLLAAVGVATPGKAAEQAAGVQAKPSGLSAARNQIAEGKEHLEKRRYSAAVRVLSAAVLKDANAAEAYLLRGQAYDLSGAPQKALLDFSKYIALRPSDPTGYIKRADVNNFNHDPQVALADYGEAVKLSPRSVPAHLGRGLANAALERYDEAIKDFQWVLTLDPDNSEALGNIGVGCMLTGRSLEAVSYFERALKKEKDPRWRGLLEKWIQELVKSADSRSQGIKGPVRAPAGRSGPLW